MDGYKHYVRVNSAGIVVYGFSNAFEQPIETDHVVTVDAGRHYNPELTNERGQYIYRWDEGIVPRSRAELDAEWNAAPAVPSLEDRTKANEEAINFLLGTVML